MKNSPLAAQKKVSKTPEGEVGAGHSHVGSSLSSPSLRLGEDMEAYVMRPAQSGHTVQCRISRDKCGVDKGMFPFYYLYLEAADGRKVRSGGLLSKLQLPGASPSPF